MNTHTALILVDLQNDFMPGGPLAITDGDLTVAVANELIPQYQTVVATQDWHPRDHGSFAVNHSDKQVFDMITLGGLDQVLWPTHCVQDTPGAAFHKDLAANGITKIFPKGTEPAIDSYSGFFDNGHRKATGLGDWLKGAGITAVDVMGLATDFCVKFTAIDAQDLGFATRLIAPGCRGVDMNPGDVDKALAEMAAKGISILTEVPTKP